MLVNLSALESLLNYRFKSHHYLQQALTHRSFDRAHNERLEFLGDGLLGLVVAALLFEIRPNASEGDLSRLRSLLVREETLAEIAGKLRLGDYLRLGSGELHSGGHRRPSILADAMEAVLAAVFLDGGLAAARDVILHLYAEPLAILPQTPEAKDPKSQLQEWLQARRLAIPTYSLVGIAGADHTQIFTAKCEIQKPSPRIATGQGSSRRLAEQAAARAMLALVE